MVTVGKCLVCSGRIWENNVPLSEGFRCEDCGICYSKLGKKLNLTEYGKKIAERYRWL